MSSESPPAPRLPVPTWAILLGALVYVASPIDVIPACPIDDLIVAVLSGMWAGARQLRPAEGTS